MALLPEADQVLRGVVPQVLESAGLDDCAWTMRRMDPVTCATSLARAAEKLRELRARVRVAPPLADAMFWAEAAAWAAARRDGAAMREALDRLGAAVAAGGARIQIH